MEKELECLRCGFKWKPIIEKPKCCPRCKRYDYFKKEKELKRGGKQ